MKKIIIFLSLLLATSFASSAADGHLGNHHAGLFMGVTSNINEGQSGFTIGAEYEFIFYNETPATSVGLIAEAAFLEHSEYVIAIPLTIRPFLGFKFFAAPAIQIRESVTHDDTPDTEQKIKSFSPILLSENPVLDPDPSNVKFLLRFGMGYDLHYGNYVVSPTFAVDFNCCQTILVLGIDFGISF